MLSVFRPLALALLLCFTLTTVATAASVRGRITDASTEKPIVFATVKLLELNQEVHTDADGNYLFEGIPTGRYTIAVLTEAMTEHAIGMVETSDEAAVTLNAELLPDGTPVAQSETDDEPRMIVRSGEIPKHDDPIRIVDMPIRGYADYIAIQPGTVRRYYGAPVHVRGGRVEEFSYSVDGFSTQDPFTGRSFTALNGNVADEIEFNPGYNDPSDGWLASGRAEVTTRETWTTSGSLEAITDNFHGEKSDFNLYAADLSGSLIPNRPGQLTYLVDGEMRTIGNRDPGSGNDWNYLGAWHGRVNWRPRSGSMIVLGTRGSYEDWKYTPREYFFNAVHAPRGVDENFSVFGTLEQEIAQNTEIEASASWFSAKHRQGDGVHFDDIWSYGRPGGNPRFDQTNLFWSWDDINLDDEQPMEGPFVALHTPVVESTFTVTLPGGEDVQKSFVIRGDEGSVWDDYFEQKGSYVGGKFELEHAYNDAAETEIGVEFQRHSLRAYNNIFPTQIYLGNQGGLDDISRFGYDELGNEVDDDGLNGVKNPLFLAGFANQHLDYRELSFDFGVRWDHFDYDAMQLIDPRRPLDPFDRATYADTATGLTAHERDSLRQSSQSLEEGELEEADPIDRLSPRLSATLAISDKSRLCFSFGRYVQRPAFPDVYADFQFLEYKVRTGGYAYTFGNPSLVPTSALLYEAEWTQKLDSRLGLSVRAYHKDISDRIGARRQPSDPNSFDIYDNLGDATIKGFELAATLERTQGFAGRISYTLSSAEERGNFFDARGNIAWTSVPPPPVTAPVYYDQRHRIVAVADLRTGPTGGPQMGSWYPLANAGVDILADIGSGFPYSPVGVHNEVTLGSISPLPLGPINSERADWTFRIDLKASKSFPVFGADLEFYFWVINLLDRDNTAFVYGGTGEPDSTGWLATNEGQQFVDDLDYIHDSSLLTAERKYELRQNDPANFDIPRQIRFGMRVGF